MEGPNPEDRGGHRYIFTYLDVLSHSLLLEPVKSLVHGEVRRAFSRCVFRSRTLPVLLRTDRGIEFRNTLMEEYAALMGMRHKLSTAMRPCELGANERIHQETQKVLGFLLNDVARAQPGDWGEFLPLVEYVIDNTPGPHGWTPRDLSHGWSAALPLEKELLPLTAYQFEPISEYARQLFLRYREIKVKVTQHWQNASEARSRLANRFRRDVAVSEGDRVVYRDPKVRSEGRVPWRRALSGPWVVRKLQGNKALLQSVEPGPRDVWAHLEDCIVCPPDAADAEERPPAIEFEAEQDAPPRSVGEILQRSDQEKHEAFTIQRRGRAYVLRVGEHVAYSLGYNKQCHVGRVTKVVHSDNSVIVHKFRPVVGGFRVSWKSVYWTADKEETFTGTSEPCLDTVLAKQLVTKLELDAGGVLSAAAARRLDKSRYRLSEEGGHVASMSSQSVPFGAESAARLEEFVQLVRSPPRVSHEVFSFSRAPILQKWVSVGLCDFLEVFDGRAALSAGTRKAGLLVAPGVDRCRETYGKHWDLRKSEDRCLLAGLIVHVLRPMVIHLGVVCTQMCVLGKQELDAEGLSMTEFCFDVADHQVAHGLHASLENPVGTEMHRLERAQRLPPIHLSRRRPIEPSTPRARGHS